MSFQLYSLADSHLSLLTAPSTCPSTEIAILTSFPNDGDAVPPAWVQRTFPSADKHAGVTACTNGSKGHKRGRNRDRDRDRVHRGNHARSAHDGRGARVRVRMGGLDHSESQQGMHCGP